LIRVGTERNLSHQSLHMDAHTQYLSHVSPPHSISRTSPHTIHMFGTQRHDEALY